MKPQAGASRVSARAAMTATLLLGSCLLTCPEHDQVEAWLYCDECIAGERETVKGLGLRAVPTLVAALDGPSAEQQAFVRKGFELRYAGEPANERAQLVSEQVSNFVAMVQKRAAVSLGDIGGDKARAALTTALSDTSLRSDVLSVIRVALGVMGGTPFTGTLAPLMASLGDTLTLTAGGATPFDGDAFASVDGAHFPPETVLVSRDLQTMRFVVTAEAGQRTVAITGLGSRNDTETTSLHINSIVDGNDRRMLSCITFACQIDSAPQVATASLPFQGFLSLWRTPPRPDTIDVFRVVNPGPALPVTARVDWVGPPTIDLGWLNCGDLAPVPGSPGPATTTSTERSLLIPAGGCRHLLVMLPGAGGNRSFVRLRIRTP